MKRILITAVLVVVAAVPVFGDCPAADKQALEQFDRAWGDASTSGNRAALEQIYASDYMNTAPGATLNRTQTIDASVRDAEAARQSSQSVTVVPDYYVINCTPNSAIITHRNVVTTTNDGKSRTTYTRSVHMLEKRNGKWQVIANAGSGQLDSRGEVTYLEQEWNDADLKQDAAWFEQHFAPNFTDVSSRTGKFSDKAASIRDMKTRKETLTSEEISDMNVRMAGDDTVVVTGTFRVVGRDENNKPIDRRTAYTDVWVKRDGRWLVLSDQLTRIQK